MKVLDKDRKRSISERIYGIIKNLVNEFMYSVFCDFKKNCKIFIKIYKFRIKSTTAITKRQW